MNVYIYKFQIVGNNHASLVEAVLLGPVGHVNHASVPGCLLLCSVEGLGKLLKGEVFVDRGDSVMGTELQHVLDLVDGADVGASDCDFVGDHVLGVYFVLGFSGGGAHHDVDSAWLGETLVGLVKGGIVDVESGNDHVVLSLILLEFLFVGGMLGISSAQLLEGFDVVESGSECSHNHPQFVGVLNSQVTQASNAQNSTFCTNLVVPLEWSIDGDACAEERRNDFEVQSLWDFDRPIIVDLHVGAVASKIVTVQVDALLAHLGVSLLAVPACHV